MEDGIWTKEDIERLYQYVQDLNPSSEEFWGKLIEFASRERGNIPSVVGLEGCGTGYSPQSFEYLMWALGIICEAWVLRNFQRKYEEGHCNKHRAQTGQPCDLTRPLHRTLLRLSAQTFKDFAEFAGESNLQGEV